MRYFILVSVLCVVPLLSACGSGNKLGREAVTGKVTLNGRPLAEGSIMFEPTSGRGAMGGGRIENGNYRLSVQGGLPPGEYIVRISAAATGRNAPAATPPGETPGAGADPPEMIPPAWNSQSRHTVEVGDGSNEFNFDIRTQ